MQPEPLRERLRAVPSLVGTPPALELAHLPADPVGLFAEWLDVALAAGVPEPLAMTVATADADGGPDARTLILKDVGAEGWAFAGTRSSEKGRQLAARPAAALNFWWQPIGRAVRVRGAVEEASAEECAADLAARSPAARAGVAPGDWVVWRVRPSRVEFWQSSPDRHHTRIVFTAQGDGWACDVRGGEGGA